MMATVFAIIMDLCSTLHFGNRQNNNEKLLLIIICITKDTNCKKAATFEGGESDDLIIIHISRLMAKIQGMHFEIIGQPTEFNSCGPVEFFSTQSLVLGTKVFKVQDHIHRRQLILHSKMSTIIWIG